MADALSNLEKSFERQKKRLIESIEKSKASAAKRYGDVVKQLNSLKGEESKISALEKTTAAKLRQLRNTIKDSIEKEEQDKASINRMIREVTKLKTEVPQLRNIVKVSKTVREEISKKEAELMEGLKGLHEKITRISTKKKNLESMLSDLNLKESLLASGKIYWKPSGKSGVRTKKSKPRKRARAKPAEKPEAKKKSAFAGLFGVLNK